MDEQRQMVICQSCGMPMTKPEDFGTNADGTPNQEYCTHCYQGGAFLSQMDLKDFTEQQIRIAVEKLGMDEVQARDMTKRTLPNLKRWKQV